MASISREAPPPRAVPGTAELAVASLIIILTTLVAQWKAVTWYALPYEEYFDFYLRIVEYQRELAAGHWPQNLPDAVRGAGHAFPRFYPPLPYVVALLADLVVRDVVVTTHLVALLPFVLGGVVTFTVLRRTGASRAGAMLGALLLVTWPYLGIVLHPRGAFAELWTLPWYPLLALAVVRTRERGAPPWWLPLPMAALVLSHAVMALWTLPIAVLATLACARGAAARAGVLALTAAGAALTAFFTLPMSWYRGTVRVADPVIMWTTPARLFQHTGLLTLPPGVIAFEALLLLVAVAVLAMRPARLAGTRAVWWAAALHAAFALATIAPLAFWQLVPPPLRYIQFPFRLHGPSGFLAAIAAGWLASRVRRQGRVVAVTLGVVPLLAGWTAYMHAHGLPATTARVDQVLPLLGTARADRGLTVAGDYLPLGSDPLALAAAVQRTLDDLAAGGGDRWERTPRAMRLVRASPAAGTVALPLTDYDFYDVRDQDGRPLRRSAVGGQLHVDVDAGTTAVVVTRRAPGPLVAGWLLSLVGVVAVAAAATRERRGQRRSATSA